MREARKAVGSREKLGWVVVVLVPAGVGTVWRGGGGGEGEVSFSFFQINVNLNEFKCEGWGGMVRGEEVRQ